MRRTILRATLAIALLLCGGPPSALAGGALIETTAPLADRSEESVKAAVIAAIDRAVRGAAAMGFEWYQLRHAQIADGEVAIQILATDQEPGAADEAGPSRDPDAADDGAAERPDEDASGVPRAASRVHI